MSSATPSRKSSLSPAGLRRSQRNSLEHFPRRIWRTAKRTLDPRRTPTIAATATASALSLAARQAPGEAWAMHTMARETGLWLEIERATTLVGPSAAALRHQVGKLQVLQNLRV